MAVLVSTRLGTCQITPNSPYIFSAPSTLEHFYHDFYSSAKTRSRRAAYSFPFLSRTRGNCTNPNTSPAQTFDPYTWLDSVAPSTFYECHASASHSPTRVQAGSLR